MPKWIMILVGCAAIWPLESLRNQYEWHTHTNIAPPRDLGAPDPWHRKVL